MTPQDQYHAVVVRAVDFIQRCVFPVNPIPSVASITQAARRAAYRSVGHPAHFGPRPATTQRSRRRGVHTRLSEMRALGNAHLQLTGPRRRRAMIASLAP